MLAWRQAIRGELKPAGGRTVSGHIKSRSFANSSAEQKARWGEKRVLEHQWMEGGEALAATHSVGPQFGHFLCRLLTKLSHHTHRLIRISFRSCVVRKMSPSPPGRLLPPSLCNLHFGPVSLHQPWIGMWRRASKPRPCVAHIHPSTSSIHHSPPASSKWLCSHPHPHILTLAHSLTHKAHQAQALTLSKHSPSLAFWLIRAGISICMPMPSIFASTASGVAHACCMISHTFIDWQYR